VDCRNLDGRCQACGRERIRYAHMVEHPSGSRLLVGKVCAERLTGGRKAICGPSHWIEHNGTRVTIQKIGDAWRVRNNGHLLAGGAPTEAVADQVATALLRSRSEERRVGKECTG
jgi:hypothetical protein